LTSHYRPDGRDRTKAKGSSAAITAAWITGTLGIVGIVITGVFGLLKGNVDDPVPPAATNAVVPPAGGKQAPDARPPTGQGQSPPIVQGSYDPSVYTNPTSGATGTRVTLSGEGYPPNARVVFRFHITQFGETRTNGDGKFSNVSAKIPSGYGQFAPQQFDVVASVSPFSATTPFMLTG
jgi:hypothetical protein